MTTYFPSEFSGKRLTWEEEGGTLERKIDEAASDIIGAPALVETVTDWARVAGRDQRVCLEA